MAGIGAARKIDQFAGLIAQSLGMAVSTFVSQNKGAGRLDRSFRGIYTCLIMTFSVQVVICLPLYLFAPSFVRIFTTDTDALLYGVSMMRTIVPFYILQSLNQIYSNAVRGFGKSSSVMILSLLGMVGVRQLFLAISMNVSRLPENVYIGYPVGWGAAAIFVMTFYWFKIKKRYFVS
jgi:Na+-driven multidrug efflux pump